MADVWQLHRPQYARCFLCSSLAVCVAWMDMPTVVEAVWQLLVLELEVEPNVTQRHASGTHATELAEIISWPSSPANPSSHNT